MVSNIHQLLHFIQSSINFGSLWAHSRYCFEHGLIVKIKHSTKGVINQISRNLSYRQSEVVLTRHVKNNPFLPVQKFVQYLDSKNTKKTLKTDSVRYFGRSYPTDTKWVELLHLSNESRAYRKIVKNNCLYTSIKKKFTQITLLHSLTPKNLLRYQNF